MSLRRLPIYLVLDCSESMAGEAVAELERGLRGMVEHLQTDPHAIETACLSVVTFSGGAEQLVPLTEVLDFRVPKLAVRSGSSLGAGPARADGLRPPRGAPDHRDREGGL